MTKTEPPSRLSQISTNWSQLAVATEGPSDSNAEAQRILLQRYAGAVYRYLLGAVRNEHVADDLAQEFALRFLRGDFRNADPTRGRFRDFLKRALSNLVTDYFRRQSSEAQAQQKPHQHPKSVDELDLVFAENWRREILNRTWEALENCQPTSRSDYYQVLRFRAEQPDLSSSELATALSSELGKPVNPAWVRQTLLRARRRFYELLRTEVSKTLRNADEDDVDDELADLGLLEYCRTD